MKNNIFSLILSIFHFSVLNAQGDLIFENKETAYNLYYHYDNQYIFHNSKRDTKNLQLISDSTVRITKGKSWNEVVIHPTQFKKRCFIYLVQKKHNTIDTLEVKEFHINKLPNPTLFLGGQPDKAFANEDRLFAKYDASVPMNVSFAILNWEWIMGSDTLKGNGSKITGTLAKRKEIKEDTNVTIKVVVVGPDGIQRIISNEFIIYPWKDDNHPEMLKCGG